MVRLGYELQLVANNAFSRAIRLSLEGQSIWVQYPSSTTSWSVSVPVALQLSSALLNTWNPLEKTHSVLSIRLTFTETSPRNYSTYRDK